MRQAAIVGGGPGGLMTAYLLERKLGHLWDATIFEASSRVGGKVATRSFETVPALYESGVAECYDYGALGPDPLRELVDELGLETRRVDGGVIFLEEKLLRNESDIERQFGHATLHAIRRFRKRCADLLPLDAWHRDCWRDGNAHPFSRFRCADVLEEVSDRAARKYLEVAVHSDLATEPHLTSGLNGLKNFLMDVPGYVGQYSIEGGMENLPRRLLERLETTRLRLSAPVTAIERSPDRRYRVHFRNGRRILFRDFDAIFVALPQLALGAIEWGCGKLRRALTEHAAHYDRPAHYLRVSMLFQRPFWRDRVTGSWFMIDAFGGTCVYDESARHDAGGRGVLGLLIAGNAALSLGNLEDREISERVLEALPEALYGCARDTLMEVRVHRWAGAVSAEPGGLPLRDPVASHRPEAEDHPELFLVGDYLFDSTLNGVCASARLATDLLTEAAEEPARSLRAS